MHSPLEQFSIKILAPLELGGYNISFTNSSLFMVLAGLTIVFLIGFPLRRAHLVPGRWQVLAESLFDMVHGMLKSTAGEKSERYVSLVMTLFLFVLFCNILGMLPYGFTVTSHIIVTFALALVVFTSVIVFGFWNHGLHFLSIFLPPGTPLWLAPMMIVLEFLAFVARPLTLAVRLAANMIAGHVLLKVLASIAIMMGLWGFLPFPLMVMFTGFELFIAVLQAYIFAILTCTYLKDTLHLH
jgi:F-type H+-transporting ATPase subunit a